MSSDGLREFDQRVSLHIFRHTADTGVVPQPQEVADALGDPLDTILHSLQRLASGRVIVLAPGNVSIWMANPFSAVPTDFRVTSRARVYFGNCIWDALGIPAILRADGLVETICGDCAEPMRIAVQGGSIQGDGIVHFGVPAKRWWDNIGFT